MLNGLSLFSGVEGFHLALASWIRPRAYCENNHHARKVLLDLQRKGQIPVAPIWTNIRTLRKEHLSFPVDAIYGGPPCQDFSVAGSGAGLNGSRGRLMFETLRVIGECRPRIVFMENSPALALRGLERVLLEFNALRYDARWTIVSAAEMGAPHLRRRIWILAYPNGERVRIESNREPERSDSRITEHEGKEIYPDPARLGRGKGRPKPIGAWDSDSSGNGCQASDALCEGRKRWFDAASAWETFRLGSGSGSETWPSWLPKPSIRRGDDGISSRVERIERMGNAIVPQAAKEAFKRLVGI